MFSVLAGFEKKCRFGHEAHIWCKAVLHNKPHKTSNILSMPCSESAKQTFEISLSYACIF